MRFLFDCNNHLLPLKQKMYFLNNYVMFLVLNLRNEMHWYCNTIANQCLACDFIRPLKVHYISLIKSPDILEKFCIHIFHSALQCIKDN